MGKVASKKRLGVRGKPLKDPNDWGLLRIRMPKEKEVWFHEQFAALAEQLNENREPGNLVRNNHLAIQALEIGLEHLKKHAKR